MTKTPTGPHTIDTCAQTAGEKGYLKFIFRSLR